MEFQMKEIGYKTTFEYGELHVAGDVTYGFRPFQLMVSAIAGCSGSVFRKILDKKRIVYDDITIQAEVERNEEKANRIEKFIFISSFQVPARIWTVSKFKNAWSWRTKIVQWFNQ